VSRSKPTWTLRRRAVFGSLVFGAFIVVYVALRWDDTSLAQTLALGGFGLIGAVVAAYVGGAAYEDVRIYDIDKKAEHRGSHRDSVEDDDDF
jgi:hypothetical protein